MILQGPSRGCLSSWFCIFIFTVYRCPFGTRTLVFCQPLKCVSFPAPGFLYLLFRGFETPWASPLLFNPSSFSLTIIISEKWLLPSLLPCHSLYLALFGFLHRINKNSQLFYTSTGLLICLLLWFMAVCLLEPQLYKKRHCLSYPLTYLWGLIQ